MASMIRPRPMEPKPQRQQRGRKRLAKVSVQHAYELGKYSEIRKAFLTRKERCEFPDCTLTATQVHHAQGRGKNLLNLNTWVGLCSFHHNWIHVHPNKARELGLLL